MIELERPLGVSARAARGSIRLYQWAFAWRVSPCRYVPSCSSYAIEAVETHGATRGLWLAARRLGRCHPWGGHGWDPVPPVDHAGHAHRAHHPREQIS